MSLFGETVMPPGPEGERPEAPARPLTPWYRRPAVVVLAAALAFALVVDRVEHDLVRTPPTRPSRVVDDVMGSRPEDDELSRVVADGMEQTQTNPAAWAHVTQVSVSAGSVVIQVGTRSDAVVERVCEQARRYMFSPNPYGPKLRHVMVLSSRGPRIGLDDKNDACVPIREEKP